MANLRSLCCTVLLVGFSAVACLNSQSLSTTTTPPLNDIVSHMVLRNAQRAQNLASYRGVRKYHLEYRGFPGSRTADMEVQAAFSAPAQKEFTVLKESGSKLVINRVFKKLLESEREAQDEENRKRTALTPENYTFTFLGTEDLQGRRSYILSVEPRVSNKFLYRGRIWVDASDFAVAKIDAEPARNPSFWISKTTIAHSYVKVDQFWLPAHNTSITKVRLGGTATLTIEYLDYKVVARSSAGFGN